jgi:hypothetical protein
MVLVAGTALDSIHAVTVRTTPDIHDVRMRIISLPREITARMAVHAPRVPKHGHHRLER